MHVMDFYSKLTPGMNDLNQADNVHPVTQCEGVVVQRSPSVCSMAYELVVVSTALLTCMQEE